MVDDAARDTQLAVIPDAVDDMAAVRRYLWRPATKGDGRPLRYVRAGLFDVAKEILAFPGNGPGLSGNAEAARGVLALRAGRSQEGIDLLRRSIERSRTDRLSERYLAAESLATELQRLGQHEEALSVLEAAAADEPTYLRTGVPGAFWLRVLARLAREYDVRGRSGDAETIRQRLGRLLALGDDTHPIRTELARSHPPQGHR
jgi:tetratricopeptide (TPR) repeat protein